MRRTALPLGVTLLSALLATPPALAAPAMEVAVTRVEAQPAGPAGDCPTTVGFSAVVTATGRGTVGYRWVRGDGGTSAVKSLRVNGTRKTVVTDRQTYDRATSGWQAIEILGKDGLSAKARFDVTCSGAAARYDAAHPLPARPGGPLAVAASVQVSPPVHRGPCPASLTFTGTVQVSRTPAKVDYRWIDSATGEGRLESLSFPAGGPRSRQVVLPLSAGGSASGWKAIRLLTPGQDSGRAAYEVTCTPGRATRSPSPSPTAGSPRPTTPRPSPPPQMSPRPTPIGTPTPTPTQTPTTPPPATPEARIVAVTPGDYAGDCLEPVGYHASGRISLPAGPATKVTYGWILDGTAWQRQVLDFPAADQPRTQDVSAAWNIDRDGAGTHTLGLMTEGDPVTRQFTFACTDDPGDARLTFHYLLTPVFQGVCHGSIGLRGDGLVTTDREAEVKYRLVVDGKPGVIRTEVLKPGVKSKIGDFWYSARRTSGTGVVRLEVLNHNRPAMQQPYSLTCETASPGTVEIDELWSLAYYGDCVDAPYVSAHGRFRAAPGTEITFRWVTDGNPVAPVTRTVGQSGLLEVQAASWDRPERKDGTVALEVLDHNKPVRQAGYPVTCEP